MISALFFGYLASKCGQPPLIGYLLAGLAIGPASRLVLMPEEISILANIGVALLMFMVGMEFSTKKIKKVWNVAIVTSLCEVGFMFFIGMCIGTVTGLSILETLFLSTALGMSGTIVCIKALNDAGRMDSLSGRIMIGILIVEDLVAIGAVSILDGYARMGMVDLQSLAYPFIAGMSFLILMLLIGKHFLPKIFNEVGKTRSRELFILAIFSACMGVAAVSFSFHLSIILGAFIAGLMLSESQYHLRISHQIESFKDIFLIIFFVSIGMSVNPIFLIPDPDAGVIPVLISIGSIIGLVFVIISAKPFINTVLVRVFKYTDRTALFTGLGLVNIGEFSFVIMKVGYDAHMVSERLYAIVVLAALITMAGTSYSIKNADTIYNKIRKVRLIQRIASYFPGAVTEDPEEEKPVSYRGHVVILGAAEGIPEHLIEFLRLEKKEFVVVDNALDLVEHLKDLGVKVFYGDPSNPVFMRKANLMEAKVVVISLPSPFDTQVAAEHARMLNPTAFIVARIHLEDEEPVIRKYANEVVLSHFVASKEMARRSLNAIGYTDEEIEKKMPDTDRVVFSDFEIPGYTHADEWSP